MGRTNHNTHLGSDVSRSAWGPSWAEAAGEEGKLAAGSIKTSEATGQVGVRQYDGLVALIETSADNI